jgi:hypothetical protein
MNAQFNKFKHDAILHLNRCKVARCFHSVLIIRTGHACLQSVQSRSSLSLCSDL